MINRAGFLILFVSVISLHAAPKKDLEQKQTRLHELKARLSRVQDSLETSIADRWNAKQQHVAAREQDKERIVRLRESQERSLMELARVKEERFAWMRRIEDKQNQVLAQKDSRHVTHVTLEELLSREADNIMKTFPLDREEKRLRLESIREKLSTSSRIVPTVREYVAYKADDLRRSKTVSIGEKTIVTDEGRPHTMHVARFGTVFAYGMDSPGDLVMIRQTGRLDAARFSIVPVKQQVLIDHLNLRFPRWVERKSVSGIIPTDILQNNESAQLISGETLSGRERFITFVKAGGPIMAVLLVLPVWAVLLILMKSLYLFVRFRRERKGMKNVAALFSGSTHEKSGPGDAKSTVEKMAALCRKHHGWDRTSAEKALRGIMLEEVPRLSRHLPMLAVIAGVAPLLGLLGTVTGMINLFDVITTYGTSDPKIMAGGISEALITTQTGLAIAIPVLLCHSWLRSRKNNLAAFLERNAIEVLNHFWPGVSVALKTDNPKPEVVS